MIKTLKTITTIELSNDCNLACRYCINRKMERAGRKRQIMSDDVFERTLDVLKELCRSGSQMEVNLNGNGESFLDPMLFYRIGRVREVVGSDRLLNMSTNGMIMTDDIAQLVKQSGLDKIQVSVHRPEAARKAGQLLAKHQMHGSYNFGAVQSPHNWAGQIDPEYNALILPDIPCHPIMEGRGYVSVEGLLSPCCYDYRLLGVFGSVFDADLLEREIRPFVLCETCHQQLPNDIKTQYGIKQPIAIRAEHATHHHY